MKALWEFILDLVFPRSCLDCNKEGAWLCDEHRTLPVNEEFYCFKMGSKTAFGNMSLEVQKDSALDGLIIVTNYEHEIVQKLIHTLKYKYVEELSSTIATSIFDFLKANNIFEVYNINSSNSTLVPIPIHKKRLRARGFNQSELIGKELSKLTDIHLNTKCIQRKKSTLSQAKLSKSDRRKNIKEAFEIISIPSDTILLLDDVITTGNTLEVAAEAFKRAGAQKVIGIVYAHRQG